MKCNISRDEKKLDPQTATKVYALTVSPLVETISELLPKNGAGLAVKLLLQAPDKILDYNVNVKVATNEGKTVYEARIEGITEVIQGAAVGSMLSISLEVLILATLPVSVPVAAIGAAVGTGLYLAYNYDSQVEPVLKAIGEFEPILINAAACYDIPPEFCPDGGRYYVIDTAGITNPTSQSQFSVLTVQNDNNGKTQISYVPGSSRLALTFDEVSKAILDYKQSSSSPNSVFFKYPQTLISLPDGKYTAMIGTNQGELLDASFSTQPVEIYAGDGDDTLKGGTGDDHHVPYKGNDLMQDSGGYDRYYIGLEDGHDIIDDSDRQGEIHYNGSPISGTAKMDTTNQGQWTLNRFDVSFVLTKQNNDLAITMDETATNPSNSITVKNFDFINGQMGIRTPVNNLFPVECSTDIRTKALEVARTYLYGSNTIPYDFSDDTLIRPYPSDSSVCVDLPRFMSESAGRFALGPQFDLVRGFLNPNRF